jgi:hypothetical protein
MSHVICVLGGMLVGILVGAATALVGLYAALDRRLAL